MENDIKKFILSPKEIEGICERLGNEISKDYKDKKPIFIGLLKGCQPFLSDLMRQVKIPCEIDYMKVSSYEGTESTGNISIKCDVTLDIKDRHILLVDDVIDTGKTTKVIKQLLLSRGAKTVEIIGLLNKPAGRLVEIDVKYIGCYIQNEFVVGYGLDYNEKYRNLPYIGVLKEEVYKK